MATLVAATSLSLSLLAGHPLSRDASDLPGGFLREWGMRKSAFPSLPAVGVHLVLAAVLQDVKYGLIALLRPFVILGPLAALLGQEGPQ